MDYSSLGDLLRKQCAAKGAKPAFLIPEDGSFATITYSDLWIRVRRYATVLEDLGLVAGDRIALQSDNGVEWALLDWASRCLGVMVVPKAPFQFSETPAEIHSKPPRFGQHTDEVLKGLGYSDADIARLRADGVV